MSSSCLDVMPGRGQTEENSADRLSFARRAHTSPLTCHIRTSAVSVSKTELFLLFCSSTGYAASRDFPLRRSESHDLWPKVSWLGQFLGTCSKRLNQISTRSVSWEGEQTANVREGKRLVSDLAPGALSGRRWPTSSTCDINVTLGTFVNKWFIFFIPH